MMAAYMTLPERPPFITVVTDLVSTHMFWYEPQAERCLVPTQAAYDRGIECGLQSDQLRLTGLPVSPRFYSSLLEKSAARQQMGWHPTLPTILMVAGGEGMGPLFEMAQAIDAVGRKCQLVIVAGKNQSLRERLETAHWQHPTIIYGFVDDMPLKMAGADILVTKAGPATITEASIAGLPMIISDAIPGQETGNVQYVVENNAGVYAPSPRQVAEVVSQWLKEGDQALCLRAENSRRLARPDAVWQIAEEIWQYAHMPQIVVKRRDYLSQILQTPRDMFPNLT
jgi:1,2-diacylglycerol 3-beta-galactosyltransferase